MTMTNNPFAAGGDIIKFGQDEPGKTVQFQLREYRTEMGTKFGTNDPEEQHVLLVTTPDGEDGKIFLTRSALYAVGDAMRAVGHNGLPEPGALMSLTFTGMQKSANGFNFKNFEATYQRPAAAAGAFAAPAQQAPQPAAAPPAQAAAPVDPAQFFNQG